MKNQMQLIGDELLVSVFAQFKKSKFKIIDETDIIKAFYKSHKDYPALFKNYSFDYDGVFPDSREIRDAIDNILKSRMMGRMNLDLKDYYLNDSASIRYEKFIKPRLNKKTISQIEQLSKEVGFFLNIQED